MQDQGLLSKASGRTCQVPDEGEELGLVVQQVLDGLGGVGGLPQVSNDAQAHGVGLGGRGACDDWSNSTAPVRICTRSQAHCSQPTGVHPVAALLVSKRIQHTDQPPKPHLSSHQAFDLKAAPRLDKQSAPKGALLYQAEKACSFAGVGHGGTYSKVDPKLYGSRASMLSWHVGWYSA